MHKKLICFAQNINISRLERHLAKLSDVANMIMAILRFAPNYKSWQLSWDNLFYLTAPKVIMFKGKSDKWINWSSDSVKGRGQIRNKSSGSRNEPLIIVTMSKSTISYLIAHLDDLCISYIIGSLSWSFQQRDVYSNVLTISSRSQYRRL